MMRAALAGLVTAGLPACTKTKVVYVKSDGGEGDLDSGKPKSDAGMMAKDSGSSTPKDSGTTSKDSGAKDSGSSTMDSGAMSAADAGIDAGPVVTKTVMGERTFESLYADCEKLGGMVQLTASCAGSNQCKGFSYGDWGPDEAVLTEHTCAHMNGCNGLSCVILPPDQGRTGKEVYGAMDLPAAGPSSCTNCHAVWNSDFTVADLTKFRLWVMPHSGRNASNWLDTSVSPQASVTAQEGIVAFGKTDLLPDGTPIDSMEGYHKLLSRQEVQRVVAYIRTLTPEVHLLLEHRDDSIDAGSNN